MPQSTTNILIVEDEPLAAERLAQLLGGYHRPLPAAQWADSVRSAVECLERRQPDLLLLDIHLGDGLSFDIFEKTAVRAPVIFTTAYDQYALRAFKVNSLDYLLKPIQREDLYAALDKFFEKKASEENAHPAALLDAETVRLLASMVRQDYKNRFLVRLGERLLTVPLREVSYFFVEDRALLLRTRSGHTYPLPQTLEQIELMLDPRLFFRINRSCILHVEGIREVLPYPGNRLEVLPEARHAKEAFVVSRELCGEFRRWLG